MPPAPALQAGGAQKVLTGQRGCKGFSAGFHSLFLSPPTALSPKKATWGCGEEGEGGGRWGEEVTSPQRAPLPRSLRGRGHSSTSLCLHSCLLHGPLHPNTSAKFKSLFLNFPRGLPSLSFPICKVDQEELQLVAHTHLRIEETEAGVSPRTKACFSNMMSFRPTWAIV